MYIVKVTPFPKRDMIEWNKLLKNVLRFTPAGVFANMYDIGNAVQSAGGPAIGDIGKNVLYKYTDSGMTTGERERSELEYQNALRMYREGPQAQIEGYQKAGLNPALMYGSQSTPSPVSTVQGNGNGGNLADLLALVALPSQIKANKASANLANANADKASADAALARVNAGKASEDTETARLNNEFMRQTFEVRRESIENANHLNRARATEIYKNLEVADANIKKLLQEVKTEEDKRALMQAQRLLADVNARQVQALLPYQKLLMSAQTSAQRAAAALSMVEVAYKEHLIDAGYIEAMTDQFKASAHSQEELAQINAIRRKLRDGTFGVTESGIKVLDDINALASSMLQGFVLFADSFPKIM